MTRARPSPPKSKFLFFAARETKLVAVNALAYLYQKPTAPAPANAHNLCPDFIIPAQQKAVNLLK